MDSVEESDKQMVSHLALDMVDTPPGPVEAEQHLVRNVVTADKPNAQGGVGKNTRTRSARPKTNTNKFEHIKVLVRIRPSLAPQQGENTLKPSLAYGRPSSNHITGKEDGAGVAEHVVRVTKGQTSFEGEFDGVLPPESSQAHVYDGVRDCISHVLAGKNASGMPVGYL